MVHRSLVHLSCSIPMGDAQLPTAEPMRPVGIVSDASQKTMAGCVGSHLVTVIAVQELNPNTMKWYAPKKYADHKTSGLNFTVDKPTNDLNIA